LPCYTFKVCVPLRHNSVQLPPLESGVRVPGVGIGGVLRTICFGIRRQVRRHKKADRRRQEKGYLTYDQVNDLIPHDVHSPEDLEDLLTTIGTQGTMFSKARKGPTTDLEKKFEDVEEGSEDVELDLTPGPWKNQ